MAVRFVRMMLVLILALSWAPLMAHCQIEWVADLTVLCCADEVPASEDRHVPCREASCCAWEWGGYHLPPDQPARTLAVLVPLPVASTPHLAGFPNQPPSEPLIFAPPELSTTWQFTFRTARPPRAPAFAW